MLLHPSEHRGAVPRFHALACVFLALQGCAFTLDYPLATESVLVAGGQKVDVHSLHCSADGEVVAVGSTESLTDLEGVAFHSGDRGATWVRAVLEPAASGVPLSLLGLPQDQHNRSLYLSGYRLGQSVLSIAAQSLYEPAPWWTSNNGGRSWRRGPGKLPLPATSVVDAKMPEIVVPDAAGTLVAAVDDRGRQLAVLRSTDGGQTWRTQVLPQLRHYGSMVSDGQGQLVLTGRSALDHGVILASSDSGATWTESRLTQETSFPFRFPRALRLYRSPAGAWIAFNNDHLGKGKSAAWIFASTDRGRTWTFARGFDRVGTIVGIAGNTLGRVIAITDAGNVLLSDDGITWWQGEHSVAARSQLGDSQIVFSSDSVVFATLDRANFMRSTDAGASWQSVASQLPDRQFVLGVQCTHADGLIVVAGSGGMLARSTDGGATWQRGRLSDTGGAPRKAGEAAPPALATAGPADGGKITPLRVGITGSARRRRWWVRRARGTGRPETGTVPLRSSAAAGCAHRQARRDIGNAGGAIG